ncbi:uncharacterized protein LOC144161674 [Haemaphysalis longicornis]
MAVGHMMFAFRDFTMKKTRRKFSRIRNTIFILVPTMCVFAFSQQGNFTAWKDLLQDENLKHIEYWSHESGQAALREGEQYEATRLPHRGGWAVEARCHEDIDVLFFVHACSRKWTRRAALRDTLIEEAAARRFNWAAVFFVGRRANDPLLDAWLNLEADALGDLVVFPFEDGHRTVTPKWMNGMQWVADHCPNVPAIVKLDDDVIVHPFKLTQYLQTELPREPARLHCYANGGQPVNREPDSRYFVRTDDAPMKEYFTYCSGLAVIMTFNVMRTLLRASPKVHPHPTDDAYVTGDLALLQGVGHVEISRLYIYEPLGEPNGSCLVIGDCIFMHWQEVAGGKATEEVARTLDARFYWSLLLLDRKLGNFTALKDLLQDDNLKHIEYWSHEVGQAALREGEQLEATRLPHRGGWAVEARCHEGIDVLFFVHACSRQWRRRAVLRDTLVEEAAARRFNWAAVFFVGRRAKDPLLDACLNLEANALGDLVVFPFEDGYRTVTPKWMNGMQWVADHCPNVPVIIKLDDDVTVHPFKLSQYLQTALPREPARLHCSINGGQPVDRKLGTRFFVRTDDAPMDEYFTYCSGLAVIMTFNVMRTLLRGSSKVHPHPTDDAYVTGDLALLQGIGHVNIGRLYFYEPSRESNGSCLFVGDCIFMHWQVLRGGKVIEEVARTLDARF